MRPKCTRHASPCCPADTVSAVCAVGGSWAHSGERRWRTGNYAAMRRRCRWKPSCSWSWGWMCGPSRMRFREAAAGSGKGGTLATFQRRSAMTRETKRATIGEAAHRDSSGSRRRRCRSRWFEGECAAPSGPMPSYSPNRLGHGGSLRPARSGSYSKRQSRSQSQSQC